MEFPKLRHYYCLYCAKGKGIIASDFVLEVWSLRVPVVTRLVLGYCSPGVFSPIVKGYC